MSRRTRIGLIVPLVLLAAYFGVTSFIRAHVDDLIQHAVDRQLPEFALTDRDGRRWSHRDLAGKRAVLHFFRSYCHSCDVEAPAIRALEARLADDIVWLHVMTDVMLAAMRMRVALPYLDRIRIRRRTAVSERMECIRGNGHKPVAEQNAQDNQMPDQSAHQEIAASGIAFASDRFFRRFLRASS